MALKQYSLLVFGKIVEVIKDSVMRCAYCNEFIPEPKATEQREKGFVCCSKRCGLKYKAEQETERLAPKLKRQPESADQYAWQHGRLKSLEHGEINTTKTLTCTTT